MEITDDYELYCAIGEARVLLRSLNQGLSELNGHYENRWFIPDNTRDNQHIVATELETWIVLVSTMFDKLDRAYDYLDKKS